MKKILSIIILSVIILFTFTGCEQNNNSNNNPDNLFKKNYTVTLIVENSTRENISVDEGETLLIAFTPQKQRYAFKGWYTDNACTVAYDFSRPVTSSFKLYAGFALTNKSFYCKDVRLKALSSNYDNDAFFNLSLAEFDYDYLERNGLGLQINITYNVKYIKDYDVPFDIGYAGSPKYELSVINSSLQGYFEENLPTSKTKTPKRYTYNSPLIFSKDKLIELVFSTDNIQNIISFTDIVVEINAIKLR